MFAALATQVESCACFRIDQGSAPANYTIHIVDGALAPDCAKTEAALANMLTVARNNTRLHHKQALQEFGQKYPCAT